MHLTLPSRLVGDVRKIRGTEITVIAEQADGAGSGDGGFSTLLGGCWLQTVERGPYPDVVFQRAGRDEDAPEKPVWTRVLKGDLLAGVIFLRQLSLTVPDGKGGLASDGDVYEFDVKCEECSAKIPWEVKLSALPLRWLPEASAERIRAGKPFETNVAGRKVLYDLQTLGQEEPIVRLMKQQRRQQGTIVDVLAGQVRSIEGVNADVKARWRWLSELSMGELFALQQAMEEGDCGIETKIEVRCQARGCGWEQEVNLPLGRRFFSPRKKRKEEPEPEEKGEQPGGETQAPRASSGTSSGASPASGGGASAGTSGGPSTGAPATGG